METTKWPAITGLVVGTILLAREIPTTFAFDKPVHTAILALLSCAGVLIGGSRLLPKGAGRAHSGANYDSLPLEEIGHAHASREPSPSPADASVPVSLRELRVIFLSLALAISLRILILRQLLLNTQCARLGWEPLIPFMFALWDYWTVQRHRKQAIQDNLDRSAYDDIDHHISQAPYRYLLASFLVGFGGLIALSASSGASSTVICSASLRNRWYLSVSQLAGTMLDIVILLCTSKLLNRQDRRGPSGTALRFASVGFAALLSIICLAFVGGIYYLIADYDRHWISTIHPHYLSSALKLNVLICLAMISAIVSVFHVGVLTTSMVTVFCAVSTLTTASTWTNSHPFPPSSSGLGLLAIFMMIIGFAAYFHVETSSEKSVFSIQKTFTKIPSWFYVLLLSLFVVRTGKWATHDNSMSYHPIDILMFEASAVHENYVNQTQSSRTLEEAVKNYEKRYGRHPPPNFNFWYSYATARNSVVIDDFDSIHRDLEPFYSLTPEEIRLRTWKLISNEWNNAAGLSIRNGEMTVSPIVPGTHRWMLDGVMDMIKPFVDKLPDMDLAFNINDEPRVVIPFEEAESINSVGSTKSNLNNKAPRPMFSGGRADQWKAIPETPLEDRVFTDLGGQRNFYTYSNAICSSDSAARSRREWDRAGMCTSCTHPQSLGAFLANWTTAADICHQPDMADLHGFFISPAAFKGTHNLYPIFSQSKVQGFNDILFPSPWNYKDKVKYDPNDEYPDRPFTEKNNTLFWRGTTSEGISKGGHKWNGMARQRFIHQANDASRTAPKQALLLPQSSEKNSKLNYEMVPAAKMKELMSADVRIVREIARCDGADCDEQFSNFSPLLEPSDFQIHWKFKYLLDLDGAGFSGRFLPFLESKSLPFKAALFREWWDDRVTAWQHFVPLDIRGHGTWATLAYFAGIEGEINGKDYKVEPHEREGQLIADRGREWAGQVLRKEDMEIYLFRLLLEWGRITDDARDTLGYKKYL
ncbi:Hypothetical protein R9X50_00554800 [Acrodontium crateriforme]|uniref:Glycosyl transferase CAP10 domain-containing protein n=1 Tax=Acrodontium crateriforme TaxID=150365 RepID=A0AAQ3M6C7_9PEZI|nr:Hypothetical protein R9X50_00554800 [Acrodontium crateriforme]